MSNDSKNEPEPTNGLVPRDGEASSDEPADTSPQGRAHGRRSFLQRASLVVGASLIGAQASGCGASDDDAKKGAGAAGKSAGSQNVEVPPGQLDAYYAFTTGGPSGDVRVLGIPSMRELHRIPVFNRDASTGWGATDFSKSLLGGRSLGDTQHIHLSYDGGTYDGRFAYVSDKAGARLARIRLETMEVDHVVRIPNAQGLHGVFPQRHKTGYVHCNSEFRTPLPNDGRDLDEPAKYGALHTAIDGQTMAIRWQVLVEGNLAACATDYQGHYVFATSYNTENATDPTGMTAAERDLLYVFHVANLEKAVAEGKTIRLGKDESPPVVDARGENGPYVLRIPVPKNPSGISVDPTGTYAVCSGKLSPTVSVIAIDKLAQAFAGSIQPRDCVVAEPEVGLGPLHTTFDGRGYAYTSIFTGSALVKWELKKALAAYAGEKVEPVLQKLDVHFNVDTVTSSMGETKEADGKWVLALCTLSKDRFLSVGPLHPNNTQLLDITGETVRLLRDQPTYADPRGAVLIAREKIQPVKIAPRRGPRFEWHSALANEDGVDLLRHDKIIRRPDGSVRVYITSMAPKFNTASFKVKSGQKVQVVLTNTDTAEDLTQGFCLADHDVSFAVGPRDTNSATFIAGEPGVYWYYCPWTCHELHLEMRGRMIVEG